LLFFQELLDGFDIHFIRHAAVDWADGRTLGFFMEPLAFGAFIRTDIVYIHGNGFHALVCIDFCTIHKRKSAGYGGSIRNGPLDSSLIDGIIGTLRFASPTINTFVRNFDGHKNIRLSKTKVTICNGIKGFMLSTEYRIEALMALK